MIYVGIFLLVCLAVVIELIRLAPIRDDLDSDSGGIDDSLGVNRPDLTASDPLAITDPHDKGLVQAIDLWIALQPAEMTRNEAVRFAVREFLTSKGCLA
jgi:hypothetical protein